MVGLDEKCTKAYWKVWGTLAIDAKKTKQMKMNCLIINFRGKSKNEK